MKKLFTIVSMTLIIPALTSCGGGPKGDMPWIVDRFDDIKVIRYEVPGFDALPLEEKELIYYLSEAARHSFRPELPGEPPRAPHAGDGLREL